MHISVSHCGILSTVNCCLTGLELTAFVLLSCCNFNCIFQITQLPEIFGFNILCPIIHSHSIEHDACSFIHVLKACLNPQLPSHALLVCSEPILDAWYGHCGAGESTRVLRAAKCLMKILIHGRLVVYAKF